MTPAANSGTWQRQRLGEGGAWRGEGGQRFPPPAANDISRNCFPSSLAAPHPPPERAWTGVRRGGQGHARREWGEGQKSAAERGVRSAGAIKAAGGQLRGNEGCVNGACRRDGG